VAPAAGKPKPKPPPGKAAHTPKACDHELSDLWLDAAKRRVLYCLAACDESELHRTRRACYSYDPASGAVAPVAGLKRRPDTGRARVVLKGRKARVCRRARCRTVKLRKAPESVSVSASGKLLAAIFSEERRSADGEMEHNYMAEIYRVRSRRRISRFVALDGPTGSVEFQWLGEILCSHLQPGPNGETLIIDYRTGKTLRTIGKDAKHEFFIRFSDQRAYHVAGKRWAFLHVDGASLVIQHVVNGAIERFSLGSALDTTGRGCDPSLTVHTRIVALGPHKLVVMAPQAPFPIALFDARKGKVLRLTKRACPGL
jgi:hypothetical protein